MQFDNPSDRLLCAMDTTDLTATVELAHGLRGAVGGVKLGKAFFTAHGPEGFKRIAETGQKIFLDLKFHDMPNTVAGGRPAGVAGADYLVIGRPITRADDPRSAADRIAGEIADGLAGNRNHAG